MKDLMKMMQQAQQIQGRMQKMQEELSALEVEGQSGAGMVKVVLNGKGDMRSVRIDPGLVKSELGELDFATHQYRAVHIRGEQRSAFSVAILSGVAPAIKFSAWGLLALRHSPPCSAGRFPPHSPPMKKNSLRPQV